jgi:hypothetical protein
LNLLSETYIRFGIKNDDGTNLTIQFLLESNDNENYYIMDFDAYSLNTGINSREDNLDAMHSLIIKEFQNQITDECRKKMRGNGF